MNRAVLVLIALALSSTVFAGCLGDGDDVKGAIPTAMVSVAPVAGSSDTFVFDATGSSGKGLRFEWSFGDGTTASDAQVEHTYTYGDGTYTAELLITDLNGITDRWTDDIVVGTGENNPPEAAFTPVTRYLAIGEPFTVDATATTDPEGDPVTFQWDFNSLMSEDEYVQFKEDKKNGVSGDDGETATVGGGNKSSDLPTMDDVKKVAELDQKSPGHGGAHEGNTPTVSLFNGLRTSEEPVYTLEEGFPDPTRFYVKLVAVDVKGASRLVLSEEIWAVEVVDTKKQEVYDLSKDGIFSHGGPSTVTDSTPDEEGVPLNDEEEWTFQIPDTISLMYVNVTWNEGLLGSDVPNDIDAIIISPSGKERSAIATDGKPISIEMVTSDGLGSGTWTVKLYATSGHDIQWVASAWARVDLDPFRDLDGEYR